MRFFLKKTAAILVLFCIFGSIIIGLFMFRRPDYFWGNYNDYPLLISSYKMTAAHPDKRNIIIGDSRGLASLVPMELGNNFINLSIAGSNYFEGYLSVEKRLAHAAIDTIICVYGADYYEKNQWFDERTIAFQFPDAKSFIELCSVESRTKELIDDTGKYSYPTILFNQARRLLRYAHFPLSYSLTFSSSFTDYINHKKSAWDTSAYEQSLGYSQFGKDSSNSFVTPVPRDTFCVNGVNLFYMNQLIKLCAEKKITLIIVMPPVNQSTFEHIRNTAYARSVNAFFTTRLKHYTLNGLNYLPDSCFGDRVHLNRRGASLFTSYVKSKLAGQKED